MCIQSPIFNAYKSTFEANVWVGERKKQYIKGGGEKGEKMKTLDEIFK